MKFEEEAKIVLSWMKSESKNGTDPFALITDIGTMSVPLAISLAYQAIGKEEQLTILADFVEWSKKNE